MAREFAMISRSENYYRLKVLDRDEAQQARAANCTEFCKHYAGLYFTASANKDLELSLGLVGLVRNRQHGRYGFVQVTNNTTGRRRIRCHGQQNQCQHADQANAKFRKTVHRPPRFQNQKSIGEL